VGVVRFFAAAALLGGVMTFHALVSPGLVHRYPKSYLRHVVRYAATMRWLGPTFLVFGVAGAVGFGMASGL
jgi:hypothetical protein